MAGGRGNSPQFLGFEKGLGEGGEATASTQYGGNRNSTLFTGGSEGFMGTISYSANRFQRNAFE